jgi:small subunit ribosomal protein S9
MQLQKYSVGRRKKARCLVQVSPGAGKIIVNDTEGIKYFQYNIPLIARILLPLDTVGIQNQIVDINIKVSGGGLSGQADAIQLGVSKALCSFDEAARTELKKKGLVTRNSKVKERKKYGLKKARKSPQFSKR